MQEMYEKHVGAAAPFITFEKLRRRPTPQTYPCLVFPSCPTQATEHPCDRIFGFLTGCWRLWAAIGDALQLSTPLSILAPSDLTSICTQTSVNIVARSHSPPRGRSQRRKRQGQAVSQEPPPLPSHNGTKIQKVPPGARLPRRPDPHHPRHLPHLPGGRPRRPRPGQARKELPGTRAATTPTPTHPIITATALIIIITTISNTGSSSSGSGSAHKPAHEIPTRRRGSRAHDAPPAPVGRALAAPGVERGRRGRAPPECTSEGQG